MAVAFGAIGTASSGTTSCSPAYPTGISASTSVLYCLVTGRANTGSLVTAPTGWTNVGSVDGGAGTFGVDTGPRRAFWFRKDTVTGSETGSVTFAFGSGNSSSTISATMLRLDKTAGTTATEAVAIGVDTAVNTGFSAIASSSLAWEAGDLLCIGTAQNIDTATQSSVAISATGVTFGTLANRVSVAVADGNDHRRILDTVPVAAAGVTAAPTYSYTMSASGSGATAFLLVRETGTPVTVALNGEEVAASSGIVSPPPSRGQAMTMAQQAVAALGVTLALVGSAITSQQGATSPNSDGNVALIGQEVAASPGTVVATWAQALSGSEATASRGTLDPAVIPTGLDGQALVSGVGTLTAAGNAVTVNLSGVELDVVPGDVLNGGTALSGAAVTTEQGAYGLAWTVALTGSEMVSASGAVFPEQDAVDTYIASASGQPVVAQTIALTGSELTSAQGDVDISADATFELVGQAVAASAGTAVATPLLAVLGQSITAAQANVGAPGGAALSGSAITATPGTLFLDGSRSYALTGQSVSVLDGQAVTSYLAFAAGQVISVEQQGLGPRAVALAGQPIAATQGVVSPPVPFIGAGGGGWATYGTSKERRRVKRKDVEQPAITTPAEVVAIIEKPRRASSPEAANTLRAALAKPKPADMDAESKPSISEAESAAEKKRKKKKAEVLLLL